MRINTTLLIMAAGFTAFSCSKEPEPVVQQPTPQRTPASPKPPVPGNSAAPAQVVAPGHTPAVKVAIKTRLAPEGVFYLLERASVVTDAGVVAYPPGTLVHLVKQEGPTAVVTTDDKREIQVAFASLTNDLDVAAKTLKSDQKSQDAVREMMARSAAEAARTTTPPPPFDRRHP